MGTTWRGVLTVKAVALSALFVGVVVLTVINRRRELDATRPGIQETRATRPT